RNLILSISTHCTRELRLSRCAVAENLSEALRLSVRTLEPLHKEVSSPSSPGANNFQMAIKELQNVSQQVADNQADSESNRSSTESATQMTKRIPELLEQRSRRSPEAAAPKARTKVDESDESQ
ncbi:hypothetical protein FGIG_11875, partial [Fasciola gigantica]